MQPQLRTTSLLVLSYKNGVAGITWASLRTGVESFNHTASHEQFGLAEFQRSPVPGSCWLLGKYKETRSLSEFPLALESQSSGSGLPFQALVMKYRVREGNGCQRGGSPRARPAQLVHSFQQTCQEDVLGARKRDAQG